MCPNEVMTTDTGAYDFSMVAGEFIDVYNKQVSQWDSIVTCFFIDTAHNVIDYIECIHKILKPGGLWVNIGPLLWHYQEQPSELQIELPWSEVEKLIEKLGFEFRKKSFKKCNYTKVESMLELEYNCVFFSAVKK